MKYYRIEGKVWPCGHSIFEFAWEEPDWVSLEDAGFHWHLRWKSYMLISIQEIGKEEYDHVDNLKFVRSA